MTKATSDPIRCFEGNTKPHEPFWVVRDAADGVDPELEFDGYISEYSWFEDEITPKMFKDDLYRIGNGGPITIRLNSYGGDVIAASLIHNTIKDYPGKVTVRIDGIAASAATVVAVAGDRLQMAETGYFMIHDPALIFFMAYLNIETMARLTDSLKTIKEGIVNAYETKSGLSRSRLSKLMTDETWMDAQKAVDLGFVDEILRPGPKEPISLPENAAMVNALQNFTKIPPALQQAINFMNVQPLAAPSNPLTDEQEREAQILRDRVSKIFEKESSNA